MSGTTKSGRLPRLRFPEFREAGGWEDQVLSRICRVTSGGTPDTSINSFWGGTIQWVTPAEMCKEENYYIRETVRTISDEGLKNCASELLPVNSVIISTRAPIGHLAINKLPMAINQGCHGLVPFSHCNTHFIYYYLLKSKRKLNDLGSGNTFKELSGALLRKFVITAPNVKEQQKIADCLSSLDDLITLEAQKLDSLKAHKKGLMQQLFPREGETQPRLRFSNEGNWTVVGLPDVSFFQEGPGIMAVDFRAEGVPLVRLAGVGGSAVTLDGCNYLDPDKVAQKWTHFRLEVNDLIISTSATFGLSSIVTDVTAGAVFYTGLIRFRPSSKRLDRGYLKTFLGSSHFDRQVESAAVGGGIKHFGPTHIKQMVIPIPPLLEQQRIASCLTSLNDLITAQTQKLEALKTHKKGLMQQLFPQVSEE